MRRAPRPAPRAGFSLIELLTVIAILAILSALIVAGVARVRSGAQSQVNTQTMIKLQKALEHQWKVTCDQCRDDVRTLTGPNPHPEVRKLVAICENDKDRAESLWMYMNLRRAMPHTFAEARTAVTLTGKDSAGTTLVVSLPPSSSFKAIQTNPAAGGDQYTESAALLYLILAQGARGTNTNIDDSMQGAQMTLDFGSGLQLSAYRDTYGTPIAYRRFYQNTEMDNIPYVRAGLTITDPLDPVGRLKLWAPQGAMSGNRAEAVKAVFQSPAIASFGSASNFDGRNKMATVISAGENRVATFPYGFDFNTHLNVPLYPLPPGRDEKDDAFGYRILKQGTKGD